LGGDHFGTWQASGLGQLFHLQAHQVGHEQEQPPASGW
jgi:hypothetical protein